MTVSMQINVGHLIVIVDLWAISRRPTTDHTLEIVFLIRQLGSKLSILKTSPVTGLFIPLFKQSTVTVVVAIPHIAAMLLPGQSCLIIANSLPAPEEEE